MNCLLHFIRLKESRADSGRWASARNGGFTLIEVLVTLAILSISFLGLAAQQTVSLQSVQQSYFRSQAALIASDMADRIRSNVVGYEAGDYALAVGSVPSGSSGNCDASTCDSVSLASSDLAAAYEMAVARLPAGQLSLDQSFGSLVQIRLMWDGARSGATGVNCNPSDQADKDCLFLNVEVGEIALR